MSNNNTNAQSGGIGFTGLLTLLFICLKLIGYINWSWWWVLSPIWISAGIVFAVICISIIIAIFTSANTH